MRTTIQQDEEKYIRNSVRAYLEGIRSEKWILGVARAVSRDALAKALAYHNSPRLAFLQQAYGL